MADDERTAGANLVLINSQKGEAYTLGSGLKKLSRRLKAVYDVQRWVAKARACPGAMFTAARYDFTYSNKEELTLERMREASVVVIAQPREKFSKPEVSCSRHPPPLLRRE